MQNRGGEVGRGRLEGTWLPLASGVGRVQHAVGGTAKDGAPLCSGGRSIRPGAGGR